MTGEHPVLIISSYNPDARQTSGNIYDFMEEFERLGGKAPIALENMNCKSFSESPQWKSKMAEILDKYEGKRAPVLLVLIGQEAWAAYLSQADSIRGKFPVLTSLASRNAIILPDDSVNLKTWMPSAVDFFNDFTDSSVKAGFVYEYDVEANINLIKHLYPNTKNIAFVSDNSYGGVSLQAHVVAEMKKHPELNLILLDGRTNTIYTISDKLHELPPNTALLMGTWRVDMYDGYFMRNATYTMMEAAGDVPTFSISSVGIGYWAIGVAFCLKPQLRKANRCEILFHHGIIKTVSTFTFSVFVGSAFFAAAATVLAGSAFATVFFTGSSLTGAVFAGAVFAVVFFVVAIINPSFKVIKYCRNKSFIFCKYYTFQSKKCQ